MAGLVEADQLYDGGRNTNCCRSGLPQDHVVGSLNHM